MLTSKIQAISVTLLNFTSYKLTFHTNLLFSDVWQSSRLLSRNPQCFLPNCPENTALLIWQIAVSCGGGGNWSSLVCCSVLRSSEPHNTLDYDQFPPPHCTKNSLDRSFLPVSTVLWGALPPVPRWGDSPTPPSTYGTSSLVCLSSPGLRPVGGASSPIPPFSAPRLRDLILRSLRSGLRLAHSSDRTVVPCPVSILPRSSAVCRLDMLCCSSVCSLVCHNLDLHVLVPRTFRSILCPTSEQTDGREPAPGASPRLWLRQKGAFLR